MMRSEAVQVTQVHPAILKNACDFKAAFNQISGRMRELHHVFGVDASSVTPAGCCTTKAVMHTLMPGNHDVTSVHVPMEQPAIWECALCVTLGRSCACSSLVHYGRLWTSSDIDAALQSGDNLARSLSRSPYLPQVIVRVSAGRATTIILHWRQMQQALHRQHCLLKSH